MIIGSFLNVVIYRLNTGKGLGGRSMCMSCSHTLRWYELVPIFSYLTQLGRCRKCSSKISVQYILVETFTALVFTLVAIKFMPALVFSQPIFVFLVSFFMLILALLIIIAVYDMRHKIIPDQVVYFFILLSLISIFVNFTNVGPLFIKTSIGAFLAGPLLALPFFVLWLVSKGRWMGFGDIKLILGIGWLLGPLLGITAILIAVWSGALIGILMLIISHKKLTRKTEIPFAPFLIFGTMFVFFTGLNIIALSNLFGF